jgi:hypothetical protein
LINVTGIGIRVQEKPSVPPLTADQEAAKKREQVFIDQQRNIEQPEDLAMMREINPLTLFIKIVPATFDLKKDGNVVVQRQALFAIVTVIPAPGVDVWRCYESVCRECPCALVRDERKSPILEPICTLNPKP